MRKRNGGDVESGTIEGDSKMANEWKEERLKGRARLENCWSTVEIEKELTKIIRQTGEKGRSKGKE